MHLVLKTYRKRWTGTEPFHGTGSNTRAWATVSFRRGEGHTRYMDLELLAYTALRRQLKHDRAQEWAHVRLTTIGKSCRIIARETLAKTLAWVVARIREDMILPEITHMLTLS